MTSPITEEQVLDTLSAIMVDGKPQDLITSGQISGVVVKNGHVGFSLQADPNHPEAINPIKNAAEEAVRALPGVLSATAMLTAHRPSSPAEKSNAPAANSADDQQSRVY